MPTNQFGVCVCVCVCVCVYVSVHVVLDLPLHFPGDLICDMMVLLEF